MAYTSTTPDTYRPAPPTTVAAVGGLEDDGSLDAWLRRHRDPLQFQKGARVRTSPKRVSDPIDYGTVIADPVREGSDWTVTVDWDQSFRNNSFGIDLRSLIPLETY